MSEAIPRPDSKELSREAERPREEIFQDIEQQGSMRLMTSARPEDIQGRANAGFHEDVTDPGVFRSFTSETYAHLHNNLAETPDELDMDFDELMEQKGIHELVDFTPILQEKKEEIEVRKGLLRRKTKEQKGTGEMIPVLYSDLREDGKKEPAVRMTYYVHDADWTDYSGRKGQKLSLEIMLPASLAKELAETLREDPQRVRDLVGTLLLEKMGVTEEGAEAIRPRFESFDAERPANETIRIQEMPVTEQEAKSEPVVEKEIAREEVEAQTAPTEKMHSLFEAFKSRADKFIREHFKGEYVETPTETNKVEISKAVGAGLIGAVASIGGIKSVADIPRWFLQKYYTNQEQERIEDAMYMASSDESVDGKMDVGDSVLYVNDEGHIEAGWTIVEKSEDGSVVIKKGDDERNRSMGVNLNELLPTTFPSPLEQKKQRLEKAINASKYLSPEKKQELLQKITDTVETYEEQLDELEMERNEKIAKLLDEAIQTRVKGTTALKEALNTVLIATGLITLRGAGYGVVAAYERWAKVKSEIAKGERKEGFAKEYFLNGFLETWDKLRLKGAKTEKEKYINLAQAVGTVLRFAGFVGLAVDELTGEGGMSGAIDKALETFEKKGALGGASENFGAQFDKVVKIATLGMAGGEAGEAVGEAKEVEEAKEVGEEAPAEEQPIADAEAPAEAEPESTPGVEPTPGVDAAEEAEPESTPGVGAPAEAGPAHEYLSRDEVEVGTVRKGDGIIRMVQRQLKFNPEKYGYTGDLDDKKAVASWVRKTAFATAKQAGFVNKDGWLGVSGKAIGNMGVHVTSEGGALKLGFFDAQTGETSTLEEMRAKGFMYDYKKPDYELFEDVKGEGSGEVPAAAPAAPEAPSTPGVEETPTPTPGVEEAPAADEPAPEDVVPKKEAAPELTEGPGGLKFTADYTSEEQDQIARYVENEKLTNEALKRQLLDYQQQYGDRPQFQEFKRNILERMDARQSHIDHIADQISGKVEGHLEVDRGGDMTPEKAAEVMARGEIMMAENQTSLLHIEEETENAQKDFEAARAEAIAHEAAAAPEPESAEESAADEGVMDSREPIKIGKETVSFRYDAAGRILGPESLLQYGASDEPHLFEKVGTDRNTMDQLASTAAAKQPGALKSTYADTLKLRFERILKAQYTLEQLQKQNLQDQHPKASAFLTAYLKNSIENLEKAKTDHGIK